MPPPKGFLKMTHISIKYLQLYVVALCTCEKLGWTCRTLTSKQNQKIHNFVTPERLFLPSLFILTTKKWHSFFSTVSDAIQTNKLPWVTAYPVCRYVWQTTTICVSSYFSFKIEYIFSSHSKSKKSHFFCREQLKHSDISWKMCV